MGEKVEDTAVFAVSFQPDAGRTGIEIESGMGGQGLDVEFDPVIQDFQRDGWCRTVQNLNRLFLRARYDEVKRVAV